MSSFPSGTAYHADSDADDEFEQRSLMTSPTQAHTDSSETSSEPPSNEHTPTTFGPGFDDGIRPRTVITEWVPEECAQFIARLGLRQYSDAFLENGIDGDTLGALTHEELKEMGIMSAGHRLKILKDIYDVKVSHGVPIKHGDYIPLSAETSQYEPATKEDILKITSAIIKLRDERIVQLEQQLTKLADDSRRLRTEIMPLFKMVKENQPLPYRPQEGNMVSPEYPPETALSPPLPSAEPEKPKTSLSRTFSKKLGLSSSTPKNHSPTHLPSTIHEGKPTHEERLAGLQPSAAANAASNQLTAGMSGGAILPHHSPNPNSPTTPGIQHQPLSSRSYAQRDNNFGRYDGADEVANAYYRNPIPTPPFTGAALNNYLEQQQPVRSATTIGNKPTNSSLSNASTLVPSREMSASVPPQMSSGGLRPSTSGNAASGTAGSKGEVDADDPSVQIFKSFRVALDDPCWKVLPAALRKYNINADWRQYALYIVYGDQERCVGLEEKPLALFKDLDREGKKPMFMLRKLANGIMGDVPQTAVGGLRPPVSGGGLQMQSSGASVRTMGQGMGERSLPGGLL